MAVNSANVLTLNSATTNITTGAYVQITAASGMPIPSSKLLIVNASTSILKIAFGAAGSEVDYAAIPASGSVTISQGSPIALGTRIAIIAISATASTGFVTVSLMP